MYALFRKYLRIVVLLVFAAPSCVAWSSSWQYDNASRVVAMADVHGAYDAMVRTLQNADIVDDKLRWSGGDSHLVIVGDLLDRGPDSRSAMDLLMRLETEAPVTGGMVHVLIGNHEAMNLVGDLRYVSLSEYAAFADDEDPEERNRWFDAWAERAGKDEDELDAARVSFDEQFPPGFFAHRQAFSSEGTYGKWLLDKAAIVVVNGTAFVHGGLSPMVADYGLDGINKLLQAELRQYLAQAEVLFESGDLLPTDSFRNRDVVLSSFMPGIETPGAVTKAVADVIRLRDSDLHAPEGPLWYRGHVACSRVIEEGKLARSLEAIGADRVVIGHTPTPGRQVMQRIGGRVIEIDTGMLSNYYNGRGHVLVLEGDSLTVVSEESREVLQVADHPRRVGARPGGRTISARDLEHLLLTGEILSRREGASGRTIVQIGDGDVTVEALFAERAGRGFYPDVAAYRLDRLLQLDMVPVTVPRRVGRDEGSLQFLPDNWLDEAERGQTSRGGSAQCPLDEQWDALYVFDSLIYNEGRSLAQMLYSPDRWQLILVDHRHAFANRAGRPRHLAPIPLNIGVGWRSAMAALDESALAAELGDVLDSRRRRALLRRRDDLLESSD